MSENIESIVEGCMPDTPSRLMYCGIELLIPKNAKILLSNHEIHPNRYLLYAETEDFESFQVVQTPYFLGNLNLTDPSKLISGGWPLIQFEPNFREIFDAQRSITTRDGRIFIKALYFHESWRSYLKAVPIILKECGMIFRGEATEQDFSNNPSSRT